MPVSPAIAEELAAVLGDLYRAAEYSLIQVIRGMLARNEGLPTWAEDRLAALRDLSGALAEVVDALAVDADGTVRQALSTAYERGQAAAIAEMGAVPVAQAAAAATVLPTASVVDRLAAAVLDTTTAVHSSILRQTTDVYREVIARSAAAPVLGVETRRAATQQALNQFVDRGVARFTDSAGRSWGMAEYAEMALRSATGRAGIEAHSDRLAAAGQQVVMVSEQPLHCKRCDPWAGKVLWRTSGAAGTVMLQHATDGGWVSVTVAGSLPDARSRGLLHPNCRCSISVYLPGVSTPPRPIPHPDGATYEDTQRQRAIERQIRKWKKRREAALDEPTRKAAAARIRAHQAAMREHVERTGLRRKSEREQPMRGYGGQGGPAPGPRTPRPDSGPTPAPVSPRPPTPAAPTAAPSGPRAPRTEIPRRDLRRMTRDDLRNEYTQRAAQRAAAASGAETSEAIARQLRIIAEMRRRRMKNIPKYVPPSAAEQAAAEAVLTPFERAFIQTLR
ncbi:phage minor capsid protein [Embleya sp. NPDC059237]|uniref:phage minor capsid protein n=1 Tax=Embleya sp. NPDC059237 TaxID=3346784 RepID=UPI0036C86F54